MTQLVIEKESFNTKDFVLPYSILHGYGERSALFEEGDVGLDKVVNVSVQLGPRGEGRQEVLRTLYMSPPAQCLMSLVTCSRERRAVSRATQRSELPVTSPCIITMLNLKCEISICHQTWAY